MITNKMRAVLTSELGYTHEEVSKMKPDVAAVVIQRKLVRPSGGMPKQWYRDDVGGEGNRGGKGMVKKVFQPVRSLLKSTSKFAPYVVVAVLAREGTRRTKSNALSSISSRARKAISSSSKVATPVIQAAVDATPAELDEALDTTSTHIKKGLVDHSLDDTWLDKLISALLVRLSEVFGSKY